MLFHMLKTYPNITHAVINDINIDLTTCYLTIRDHPNELIMSLRQIQTQYYALTDEVARRDYYMIKRDRFNTKVLGHIENGQIVKAEAPVISAQCIRVPVLNGHTATVSISFAKKPTKEQLLERLVNFSGKPQEYKLPAAPEHFVQYLEDDNRPQVALDVNYENGMGVSIGRLREDNIFDFKFVGLSHNTLRGAAGGAVECAEMLTALGYIEAK